MTLFSKTKKLWLKKYLLSKKVISERGAEVSDETIMESDGVDTVEVSGNMERYVSAIRKFHPNKDKRNGILR